MSRLVVFRVAVILLFVGLTARLWDLQLNQGKVLADEATAHTRQTVYERPLRGEIFASDGRTRLAESLPAYTIAIRPNQLPNDEQEQQKLFARLDTLLGITGTLVLSPTEELRYAPGLREGLESVLGPLPETVLQTPILTASVPVSHSLQALMLTQRFTQTLRFQSPTAVRVASTDLPAYQTLPITTTRSLDLALLVKENAVSLPGVVVERDYQRHYPQSSTVRSLSHLLGYVGPADKCDIMRNNPPRSWIDLYPPSSRTECELDSARLPADTDPLRYMLTDRIGQDGLEHSYETALRGQLGEYQIDVDVHQRQVTERRVQRPTQPGNNLILTIDFDLQRKTEAIVQKWIAEAERRRVNWPAPKPGDPDRRAYTPIEAGVAVVLEVNSGRVLAMVSWPSYDNNLFNRRRSQAEVEPLYNGRYPQAINQAIAGRFPPGSTWKQISAATALEHGVIGPSTLIRDPGVLFIKNKYYEADPNFDQRFPNSTREDRGWIDVREALRKSSNVFFQSVLGGTDDVRNLAESEKTKGLNDPTAEKFAAMARAFGFGSPTGIPLPGELRGTVPSKSWKAALESPLADEPWSTGDTYNFAIGQGNLLVTPLQLAVASAAVANGGTLYQPQLVKSFTDANGRVVGEVEPVVNQRLPVSPANLQVIREGMHQSVLTGWNSCARSDISGLAIAGKTGTAEYEETIDPNIKVYDPKNKRIRSHAWFAGFAPYDQPEIEVVVLIEGAGDMSDGSATIAVPAVTEIMQAYFGTTPPPASFAPVEPYDLPCH